MNVFENWDLLDEKFAIVGEDNDYPEDFALSVVLENSPMYDKFL